MQSRKQDDVKAERGAAGAERRTRFPCSELSEQQIRVGGCSSALMSQPNGLTPAGSASEEMKIRLPTHGRLSHRCRAHRIVWMKVQRGESPVLVLGAE